MNELQSGTVPEPVELATTELDIVAGGRAVAFVKQPNKARVSIGNNDTITTGTGNVSIGTDNMVFITQSNTNSGNVPAMSTSPATVAA
jgi:hypothetical protein